MHADGGGISKIQVRAGAAHVCDPTSYLELITLFQQLLAQKRAENEKAYSRYSTGLQKLQSSSEQCQ